MRNQVHIEAKSRVEQTSDALKCAKLAVKVADAEVRDAKDRRENARKAKARINNTIDIIERHAGGADKDMPRDVATPYIRCLLSGLKWEFDQVVEPCVEFALKLFPNFSREEIAEFAACTRSMTSIEMGDAMGVTEDEWWELKLTMIAPAGSTSESYDALKRDRRNRAKQDKYHLNRETTGARTLEQRRADERVKRDEIEAYAKAHGGLSYDAARVRMARAKKKCSDGSATDKKDPRPNGLNNNKSRSSEKRASGSKPPQTRASKRDEQGEENAAPPSGRDLPKANGTSAEVGMAIAEAFLSLRERIVQPLAIASSRPGALARAVGPLRAPRKATGS
ncbi:hypothetical protein [Rhizobium grahamii]|uniref:Uncharacterized protein n=1 Tax=Rhizobium grahamii CCGE 502 TaxID=990285 RepID=S3IHR3_9HYPH|nr:hypothetical protein [Rhizobium grahamii]EPE98443.1 hypothetical protein RGCCGE502_08450 [Rhizobium grahamii CCGE 502]